MIASEQQDLDPGWEENVQALALKVRRRPLFARELRLLQLVRFLSERWRTVSDLQTVSEEAPVTAWIIRRKSDVVLPQVEPENEPEVLEPVEEYDEAWIEPATMALQQLWHSAQAFYSRPVSLHSAHPYRPIKGATVWKLAWSWPRLRVPKSSIPERVVTAENDPLEVRMDQFMRRLRSYERPVPFELMVNAHQPSEVVTTFLAMVHLWHRQEVQVEQPGAFDPIWISLGG
ncbi:hypothetical protein [Sulfobacillus thermosulfidooxidans]|uniref:hypothetical protein n=1 Tax=Sulfobacillus thermosulfidooxidans TaxID=28034 RepID=UPI000418B0A8|nr:hypothetical protein [Sulfobacillus thermosulfidooxidans]